MPVSYHKWFAIRCLHDYFADGLCRVLTLRPTAECMRVLARHRCLFRPMDGGGAVYYGASGDANLLEGCADDGPLAFTLTSTDAWLETYTDTQSEPPAARASPAQSFYYFNNTNNDDIEVAGEAPLLLHPPGKALADGPVAAKSAGFRFDFGRPLREAALSVIDSLHKRTVWETKTPATDASGWNLDLAGVPAGRYTLNVDGRAALEFYLFDGLPVSYWGLVEIFPGAGAARRPVPEKCRLFDSSGNPRVREFAVSLQSRSTIWRYHIVDNAPDQRRYDDFTVIGSRRSANGGESRRSREIPFVKVPPDPDTGEGTLLFESKQGIPLRQAPSAEHVFTFKSAGASAAGELALPYAAARNTRVDSASGEPRMRSDIYVYL